MSFIVFRDSFGLQNLFNTLVNEIKEGWRVLTQKQGELGQASASYIILNQHIPLLALHLY